MGSGGQGRSNEDAALTLALKERVLSAKHRRAELEAESATEVSPSK